MYKKCSYCGRTLKTKSAWTIHEKARIKNGICKLKMRNITINLPENYEYNIQKLKGLKLIPSRSEAIRTALREFLNKEFNKHLELLKYFNYNKEG